VRAFFRTLDETLGSGIGWSLSPTSEKSRVSGRLTGGIIGLGFTLEHVFDKHGAFCDVLFDDELFVIRGDEKNHGWIEWRW